MMTKRHYQQFANTIELLLGTIRDGFPMTAEWALRHIAIELADICQRDNPRFDRERFMKACGL